jgi:hypothetical protein
LTGSRFPQLGHQNLAVFSVTLPSFSPAFSSFIQWLQLHFFFFCIVCLDLSSCPRPLGRGVIHRPVLAADGNPWSWLCSMAGGLGVSRKEFCTALLLIVGDCSALGRQAILALIYLHTGEMFCQVDTD